MLITTDLLLTNLEPDYSDEDSIREYAESFKELNQLLLTYQEFSNILRDSLKYFESNRLELLFTNQDYYLSIQKHMTLFRAGRLKFYEQSFPKLVQIVKEMRGGEDNFRLAA